MHPGPVHYSFLFTTPGRITMEKIESEFVPPIFLRDMS